MVYLVEHFYSIQGEGRYVGVPSLFIRLGGCNMRCEGFGCEQEAPNGKRVVGCDTVYAVNRENFAQNWIAIEDAKQLISVLDQYELPENVDVVLTGGEPLMYADDPVFITFLEAMVGQGHRITFETNGSIAVDFESYPVYKACVFALSVKLENSGESYNKRIKPNTIFALATNAKEAFFKFSIDADSIDIGLDEQIEEIIAHAPKTQVYCMPVGSSKAEVEKNAEPLIEYCKVKGHTYSDRLHIRIWDEVHGV
ncbi:MAG: 7-carboxy-7-deazaguanine synthase QueE [Helicobacteraceae bacterium]|jgi:7-carboxy-7-deazaguanine synthase|nr:7-carboxy-7-deazaguanine synthase QueE [Helicobacteraceae bacterium]